MNKNEIFKKMKKDVVYFFWKNDSPLIVCAKICGIENEIGEQIEFYKFLNDNFSNLIKEKSIKRLEVNFKKNKIFLKESFLKVKKEKIEIENLYNQLLKIINDYNNEKSDKINW